DQFTLGGDGLGAVQIDQSVAPVLVDATHVRYGIIGSFAAGGVVTATFTHGTWSTLPIAGGASTVDPAAAATAVTLGHTGDPFVLVRATAVPAAINPAFPDLPPGSQADLSTP